MIHFTSFSKHQRQAKEGFTLIELLTVIAIIAILSAILIPTVGQMRETAVKTADTSKLRQISAASLLYATQNREKLVGETDTIDTATGNVKHTDGTSIADVAATLAVAAGLNDISAWTSDKDPSATLPTGAVVQKTSDTSYTINTAVAGNLSFDYVTNLNMSTPSNTPLAFTRMYDSTDVSWDPAHDPYDGQGGHIVFMGGNVQWFETLTGNLVDGGGNTVDSIDQAIQGLSLAKDPLVRANKTTEAPANPRS